MGGTLDDGGTLNCCAVSGLISGLLVSMQRGRIRVVCGGRSTTNISTGDRLKMQLSFLAGNETNAEIDNAFSVGN